jgi:hypothetical protein
VAALDNERGLAAIEHYANGAARHARRTKSHNELRSVLACGASARGAARLPLRARFAATAVTSHCTDGSIARLVNVASSRTSREAHAS